jgi:hypothetical protein
MAYTFWRRTPRCTYHRCRARAADHLFSVVLGIDDEFCPEHSLALVRNYPGVLTYLPPPSLRTRRARHRRPAPAH